MKIIKIGKILNTHGLKGDLKISLESYNPSHSQQDSQVQKGSTLYVGLIDLEVDKSKTYTVEKINFASKRIITKFHDLNSIDDAQKLKGLDIFMLREDFDDCGDDEFYLSDLLDFLAISESGKELGIIKKFYTNGVQDIAVIEGDHSMDYPLLEQFILEIDENQKMITLKDLEII